MHRQKKENQLKKNLEVAKERSKRDWMKTHGKPMPIEQQKHEEKLFAESVQRVDKTMLDKVWNDKKSEDKAGRLRGYFGGITFKNGKIVR